MKSGDSAERKVSQVSSVCHPKSRTLRRTSDSETTTASSSSEVSMSTSGLGLGMRGFKVMKKWSALVIVTLSPSAHQATEIAGPRLDRLVKVRVVHVALLCRAIRNLYCGTPSERTHIVIRYTAGRAFPACFLVVARRYRRRPLRRLALRPLGHRWRHPRRGGR